MKKQKKHRGLWTALFLISAGAATNRLLANSNQGNVPMDEELFPSTGNLISKHYDISDFTTSDTAQAQNITQQFTPPSNIVKKGSTFAFKLLDPLTDCYGQKFDLNSWYRSPELQAALGQSLISQHGVGNAVDINPRQSGINRTADIIMCLLDNNLPFDQLIIEEGTVDNPQHIHISYNTSKTPQEQRNQVLRYNGQDYLPRSIQWLYDNYG